MQLRILSPARTCSQIACSTILLLPALSALEFSDVRLASEPAISRSQIAFAYANDLWVAGRDGDAVRRLTQHEDFPILQASAGGERIVYEQAGYLHVYNPATQTSTRLQQCQLWSQPHAAPFLVPRLPLAGLHPQHAHLLQ